MKALITAEGDVVAVYSDKNQADKLGTSTITRASSVEFNNTTKEWEATLPCGEIIAKGKSRDQVIRDEIAYLEQRLHEL